MLSCQSGTANHQGSWGLCCKLVCCVLLYSDKIHLNAPTHAVGIGRQRITMLSQSLCPPPTPQPPLPQSLISLPLTLGKQQSSATARCNRSDYASRTPAPAMPVTPSHCCRTAEMLSGHEFTYSGSDTAGQVQQGPPVQVLCQAGGGRAPPGWG